MSSPVALTIDRIQVHQTAHALNGLNALMLDYASTLSRLSTIKHKLLDQLDALCGMTHLPDTPRESLKTATEAWKSTEEKAESHAAMWTEEASGIKSELSDWYKTYKDEERNYDQFVVQHNAQIKRANAAYNKSKKRSDPNKYAALQREYLAFLEQLGSDLRMTTAAHSSWQTSRHDTAISFFASSLSKLIDAECMRSPNCGHERSATSRPPSQRPLSVAPSQAGRSAASTYRDRQSYEALPSVKATSLHPSFQNTNLGPEVVHQPSSRASMASAASTFPRPNNTPTAASRVPSHPSGALTPIDVRSSRGSFDRQSLGAPPSQPPGAYGPPTVKLRKPPKSGQGSTRTTSTAPPSVADHDNGFVGSHVDDGWGTWENANNSVRTAAKPSRRCPSGISTARTPVAGQVDEYR